MDIRTRTALRSLKDIRTRSGNPERVRVPYMAYMKISCLEMEKARRQREKHSAQCRIGNIDTRLSEIEVEKDTVLKSLGERKAGASHKSGTDHHESGPLPDKDKGCLKIRY
ncbi:MAG: hypothetical protein AB1473_03815 [Thermodesulfobacteriota bacterium]